MKKTSNLQKNAQKTGKNESFESLNGRGGTAFCPDKNEKAIEIPCEQCFSSIKKQRSEDKRVSLLQSGFCLTAPSVCDDFESDESERVSNFVNLINSGKVRGCKLSGRFESVSQQILQRNKKSILDLKSTDSPTQKWRKNTAGKGYSDLSETDSTRLWPTLLTHCAISMGYIMQSYMPLNGQETAGWAQRPEITGNDCCPDTLLCISKIENSSQKSQKTIF